MAQDGDEVVGAELTYGAIHLSRRRAMARKAAAAT